MHRLRVFGVIPGTSAPQVVAEIKAHPSLVPNKDSRQRIINHLADLEIDVVSVQLIEEATVELH